MTTVAKLLARKQALLERLAEDPGPHERESIQRLIAEIDAALNQIEGFEPVASGSQQLSPKQRTG